MSEPTWELLGGGGAVGGPIDYVGDWVAGTTYQPGQVVRYNGVDYLAVNPSLGQTPPTVLPWSSRELGIVEGTNTSVTLSGTGAAGATVLLTLPSIVFDGTKVRFDWCIGRASRGGAWSQFGLYMDGTLVRYLGIQDTTLACPGGFVTYTPPAGAHIFSLRGWSNDGVGSAYLGNGLDPSYYYAALRAERT